MKSGLVGVDVPVKKIQRPMDCLKKLSFKSPSQRSHPPHWTSPFLLLLLLRHQSDPPLDWSMAMTPSHSLRADARLQVVPIWSTMMVIPVMLAENDAKVERKAVLRQRDQTWVLSEQQHPRVLIRCGHEGISTVEVCPRDSDRVVTWGSGDVEIPSLKGLVALGGLVLACHSLYERTCDNRVEQQCAQILRVSC